MNNLRQAAEQEPVAWMTHSNDLLPLFHRTERAALMWGAEPTPLYTSPPQRKHEQEPVAWMEMVVANLVREGINKHKARQLAQHFTAPPQRKPLTDEEIEQAYRHIYRNVPADFDHTSMGWIEHGIRYAEQAHGIGEKK